MTFLQLRQIPGKLFAAFRNRIQNPLYMTLRALQSGRHRRDLTAIFDRTDAIRAGDILLFACMRNEAVRIPWFLSYYRRLGVNHFLFVDNGSDDGLQALAEQEPDVSLWYTEASYAESNFGMHWLNHLLRRYGTDHWCVTLDPDEFLVYPHMETRSLRDLGRFLRSENRRSFSCLMLDMYNEGTLEEAVYHKGQDPLEVSPCFDRSGYGQHLGWLLENCTRGGVRRRVFFEGVPEKAPALNKTPFVFWRRSYSYFLSMHQLVPSGLNRAHEDDYNLPTGCLLHFKYFSLLKDKVEEEIERGEHWDDSFEYRQYQAQLDQASPELAFEESVRFEGWRQLIGLGLLNPGRWF